MNQTVSIAAILMMVAAMTSIPMGDTAGKLLIGGEGVAPAFVAWSRFTIGALLVLPLVGLRRLDLRLYLDWRIWLRALLIVCGISAILTALRTEPIANVFAAFFVGPILSYFLSAWLLGEKITLGRTALLLLGFVGVLLVVKPGFDMGVGIWFAVLAGVFYGCFLVASRWLAHVADARMMLLAQLSIGALALAPFGAAHLPELSFRISWLVVGSALGSALGNLLLLNAYQRMGAAQLAPLVYVQLIAATVLGVIVFGDTPDALSLLGLGLLLASGFASLLPARR